MDSKNPPPNPFGYTFTAGDIFGTSPTAFTNGGASLLSENENQNLLNFFSQDPNSDPFLSDTPFVSHTDAKDGINGINEINWAYIPPATIHRVSTTIPDQAQLHHGFSYDHGYVPEPLSASHLGHTQDDLQAASTLFTNAQASYTNGTSHSFHDVPSASTDTNIHSTVGHHTMPMIATSHGLLPEPLVAVLPHHTENGSVDAQIAAQFASSQAQQHHEAQLADLERQRPKLKRSYTYGTDSAFNSSGFMDMSPSTTDDAAAQRLLLGLHHPRPFTRQSGSDSDDTKLRLACLVPMPSDDERQSDGATSGDDDDDGDDGDDDMPTKKKQKAKNSTFAKAGKTNGSARKMSSATRLGKYRKPSLDETFDKKKRLSSAGQKAQRENLSDEQKRSNHILSEQKRRNLIKRGFDDLHDLVPAIRNGGLSKSSVLTEAANFLDKLIEENSHFLELSEAADG